MITIKWHPPCFDSQRQYQRWRDAASRSGEPEQLRQSRYCSDCTPEYQQRMKAEGRCLHPNVTFVADADGLIRGQRS